MKEEVAETVEESEVALVFFLSHIGSFVPADSAIVGLTDRILCAMGNKPMTTEQSTFMIDLHQVGMMLRQATSRSLCLLDEFGKGTLAEDCIGLLGGVINHFVNYEDPPKSGNIKFYTMSVLRPDSSGSNIEDIVFLYRLVPGQAPLSYGLNCARLAGVPKEVVQRAADILEMIKSKMPIDRFVNQSLSAKDQLYEAAVDKLLVFDAQNGDLNAFFNDIFPSES